MGFRVLLARSQAVLGVCTAPGIRSSYFLWGSCFCRDSLWNYVLDLLYNLLSFSRCLMGGKAWGARGVWGLSYCIPMISLHHLGCQGHGNMIFANTFYPLYHLCLFSKLSRRGLSLHVFIFSPIWVRLKSNLEVSGWFLLRQFLVRGAFEHPLSPPLPKRERVPFQSQIVSSGLWWTGVKHVCLGSSL